MVVDLTAEDICEELKALPLDSDDIQEIVSAIGCTHKQLKLLFDHIVNELKSWGVVLPPIDWLNEEE